MPIAAQHAPATADAPLTLPTGFAQRLIDWQRVHGRHDLPWQRTRDPYRVWLSEIMLQQTQVGTVQRYYARFLERFPDVAALAAAPVDEVLAAWAGLGYYSRARNLHRCAQEVVARFGGRFPSSSAELASLPGIGRSTAAAIAAFCFDERAAILDGNVKRVLTRLLGFDADLARPANERVLWAAAQALLPDEGIADYTQGLMDLGASLCSQRSPTCLLCPAAALCVARRDGNPERYPVKQRSLRRGRRENWWLWAETSDGVWLVRRPDRGVWAGLWTLPLFDTETALLAAARELGHAIETLPTIVHALTHLDWTLHPRRLRGGWDNDRLRHALGEGRLVPPHGFDDVALPAPLRRLLDGVS